MAYSSAVAWYVDSVDGVRRCRANGFTAYCVPAAGLGAAAVDAILAELRVPGESAIIDLSGYSETLDGAGATAMVRHVAGKPGIIGYQTFDEPNAGDGSDDVFRVQTQVGWYQAIKTLLASCGVALTDAAGDPAVGAWVFVNYRMDGTGFPDAGAVVAAKRQAWDVVTVDCYPRVWDFPDSEAAAALTTAAAAARATFAADAWVIPFLQVCGCSVESAASRATTNPAWKDLRDPSGVVQAEWGIWHSAGIFSASHAVAVYGAWGTVPQEDISMRWTPGVEAEGAAMVAAHKAAFA